MTKVSNISEKVADLRQSDAMLQDYVRIRYTMTGSERLLALVQWANSVDSMMADRNMGPEKYAEVSNG
tara:strand:- start:9940 stop:10143 length:204 start_codon:yes stop_codon:yes gene_type:complete